jgi:hypothetical protein
MKELKEKLDRRIFACEDQKHKYVLLDIDDAKEIQHLLSSMGDGWVKLRGISGEIPDIECWVVRNGEVIFSPKGDAIIIGMYSHYLPINKPLPPTP